MSLSTSEARALAELEFLLSGPHSLREISAHLGLSCARVHQLEQNALRKLHAAAQRSPMALSMRGGS